MKLERLIAMLTCLLQRERIPATWFAEKFQISIRTVYRDIAVLENAGIPIVTFPGVNGGISILDTYKIDKKLFTQQDIVTLLTSLKSISGSVQAATLNRTLQKIEGLIPQEHSQAIALSSRQLYIDMTPWADNPAVSQNLHTLQQALAQSRLICFDYSTRYLVDSSRRTEPHQLILKESSWYLRAFCLDRQDFRTFKLSRMRGLRLLEETFLPRPFEDEVQDFKEWQHQNKMTVELLVDNCLQERMLDFCRPDQIRQTPEGLLHVHMYFVDSDMGYGVILSLGHHCKVLSPPAVQEELIRRIELLRNVY